ncbi:hypothetical protein BDV10DRAFT_168674 [Aspergillus recurvatus]
MENTKMPINLTFAGKAHEDSKLLEYAYAFEQATKCRSLPPLVPELDSDVLKVPGDGAPAGTRRNRLAQIDVHDQSKEMTELKIIVKAQGIWIVLKIQTWSNSAVMSTRTRLR